MFETPMILPKSIEWATKNHFKHKIEQLGSMNLKFTRQIELNESSKYAKLQSDNMLMILEDIKHEKETEEEKVS